MPGLVKRGGSYIKTAEGFTNNALCCCEPIDCATVNFDVVTFTTAYPDASRCTDPTDPCSVATANAGVYHWDFSWADIAGATYKLWRKASGTCDSNNCPDNTSGYDLYGTYATGVIEAEFDRIPVEEVLACNQGNYQCWLLEVIIDGAVFARCCQQTISDYNNFTDCNAISITASDGTCEPFPESTAGVKSVSVSFTAYCPGECAEACGDSEEQPWSISVDGSEMASGTGFSGSWSGEVSCSCPDENPCETGSSVTVVWGPCSKTVEI